MELLQTTIDELNNYTDNWEWRKPKGNVYLGKCFTYKRHLDELFILKSEYSVEDVIESWKTEKLIVECNCAIRTLLIWLYVKKYGYNHCNTIKEKLMDFKYDGPVKRDFFYTFPFDEKMNYCDRDNSNYYFSIPYTFSYFYLRGCEVFKNYEQEFPKLDSSFQGENLLVADPEKDTYVGFFRDVSKSLDKAKYIIKSRKEIETQLINNCKNELLKYYPNTLFRMDTLLKLQQSNSYTITVLSSDYVLVKIGDKYYEKHKRPNMNCPCGSKLKFKKCCGKL